MEPTHGAIGTYTKHGCRCHLCMESMREREQPDRREYWRARRQKIKEEKLRTERMTITKKVRNAVLALDEAELVALEAGAHVLHEASDGTFYSIDMEPAGADKATLHIKCVGKLSTEEENI